MGGAELKHPSGEIKEIEPRGKILVVRLMPKGNVDIQVAQMMFGKQETELEKFAQMMSTGIKIPSKEKEPTFLGREAMAILNLPESVNDIKAMVVLGSPYAAYPRKEGRFVARWKWEFFKFIRAAVEHKVPILGICFGEQALAEALGGKAVKMEAKDRPEFQPWEAGWSVIRRTEGSFGDPIMEGLGPEFVAAQNHEDTVARLPEGAKLLAENEFGVQGFRIGNAWGFQFHPERLPEKVEDLLKDEENREELRKLGMDPDKILELGKVYAQQEPQVDIIFRNFLRYAWAGVQ